MSYLGPLTFIVALLSSCSAVPMRAEFSSPPIPVSPPKHISLQRGETRTFQLGALRAGDVVSCELGGQLLHIRVPNRPAGGWAIGTGAATPSGSTRELQLKSNSDGSVTASCGAKTT